MFRHPTTLRVRVFATVVTLVTVYCVAVSSVDGQQMEKRHTQLYRQRAFESSFPKVGQVAPDIHLKTIHGQPVQLSAYLGKPLVLIKGSYT